ncbi:Hybrid sensor histidine kinase/response regulator [Sulfidibacter corallicola]|uniref:histidine kinase n=2 Tax=Sulfidibacter corallicola TaxID=2818388 RepID=A0A8A4TVN3_SULCO|nr:hybrid sensor histidine kinase/response regulator [Sulfidibacter corallicola]QTD53228.1 hybrid sensor histidine kinase/response regulator [Sulfidibacter corallicola]
MKSAPHILYIEDNEFNQRLIRKILEPAGFKLSSAFDGIQGIKQAIDLKPDLILMDLELPQIDGLGAATKIKSLPGLAKVPIVALTSKTSKRDRDQALVAGCDGYIEKPINARTFADQVRRYLKGEHERIEPANKTRILRDFNVTLVNKLQAKIEELEKTNQELRQSKEELLHAYEQSQNWNLELQRLTRLKENIVGITSHELRTPLSIATGYIDLLLEGMLGELNDDTHRVLQISQTSLAKMSDLITKITDLTRLALKKFPMNLEVVDINEIFKNVREGMSFFMKIRNLDFHMERSDEPIWVQADPNLIEQVLSNLLKNAICFTPDHGKIEVKTWIQDNKGWFEIADTGIGIKEEDLEKIFDEFYQVTDVNYHKTGQFEYMTRGIGVGLALCKGILSELGGKIGASSSGLNQGSSFTFYLPMVTQE